MSARRPLIATLVVATITCLTSAAAAQEASCPDGASPVQGRCSSQEPQASGDATASYGTHPDEGLIIAGSITLGVGYLTSIVLGALGPSWLLFIPVAGGLVHGPLYGGAGAWAIGASVSGVQIIGLIILIAGLAHNHPNESPSRAGLQPEILPGPGEAGLGLRWRF